MQHDAIRALVNLCLATAMAVSVPAGSQAPPDSSAPLTKPRVFVTESQSWEAGGQGGGGGGIFVSRSHAGARPQTAEIIKTFGEKCPDVTVNNRQDMADYIVLLDHEGGKGALSHKNKIAVFEHSSGDVVVSHSTLSLGGSVENACKAIAQHWAMHGQRLLAAKDPPAPAVRASSMPAAASGMALLPTPVSLPVPSPGGHESTPASPPPVATPPRPPSPAATLTMESTPAGGDIEIDGNFIGNTPSTVTLTPGAHEIAVKKKGFATWTRKMNVLSGSIRLTAELVQEPAK